MQKVTPSGITGELHKMGREIDTMIKQSENIIEDAYLRNIQ